MMKLHVAVPASILLLGSSILPLQGNLSNAMMSGPDAPDASAMQTQEAKGRAIAGGFLGNRGASGIDHGATRRSVHGAQGLSRSRGNLQAADG